MSEYIYLIDNDVLSTLTMSQRNSARFRESCRVPEEILFEARGYIEGDFDKDCVYQVTPSVLLTLSEVMATLASHDLDLVDLYANKGNGDVLLLATAIDGMRGYEGQLWAPAWKIVTEDNALKVVCRTFGIETISREDFVTRF